MSQYGADLIADLVLQKKMIKNRLHRNVIKKRLPIGNANLLPSGTSASNGNGKRDRI
jgi:hypothetical protein